ncbi:GNAT family N-acetyltransferase [Candidatus Atribacteria bacterium HGW-Atribacteria-1]|nr:MAG: GNAT family N-acetyltransferase [Candidatus Atribacteria bacterium HGW-Atribacteria-1]
MHIRTIRTEDAKNYLNLCKKLDRETEFRLYEPGEMNITIDQQRKIIRDLIKNKKSTLLVVDIYGQLVGYLLALGRDINRVKHCVHVSIGILQNYVGQGIGTKLFIELEKWAIQNQIHRLELTVMVNNKAGQALYKKMGFKVEGVKEHSLFVNGRYIDDIYMAKLI